MTAAHVQDITAANFQADVIERSTETPVLIDFWAAWCGPCKTLGPVLEKVAGDYGGAFVLGKVDADKEQDLAYAFGVQGIPFCVLVKDGRPADGFQGALPEAEVIAFLERNGIQKGAGGGGGDAGAQPAEADPDSPEARFERARLALSAGDTAAAQEALTGIPEEDERYDAAQRLISGLPWLDGAFAADGSAGAPLAAARERFLQRDFQGAMDHILESATVDRDFEKGLARRAMLLCFAVVGEEDERLDAYRRRLATLLY